MKYKKPTAEALADMVAELYEARKARRDAKAAQVEAMEANPCGMCYQREGWQFDEDEPHINAPVAEWCAPCQEVRRLWEAYQKAADRQRAAMLRVSGTGRAIASRRSQVRGQA